MYDAVIRHGRGGWRALMDGAMRDNVVKHGQGGR